MQKTLRSLGIPILTLALAAIGAAQQAQPVTLKVGSPAPAMDIKKWVKGTPVATLGHGKVNVVEFWATWCGPCKKSIPHLTELAHKYKGKATFTGVSVFEDPRAKDESFLKTVDTFVKTMGDKMDYNVGADGLKGSMANKWMIAAGQEGIPTAFVVDQKGTIAWIGHPMMGLDEVVQKVVDGKFDIQAEVAKQAEEDAKKAKDNAENAKLQADAQPFIKAMGASKFDDAIKALDVLISKYPSKAAALSMTKFNVLMKTNEPEAYKFGKELASGLLKDNGDALNSIAWLIVDDKSTAKKPDYVAAVIIAKQSVEANKSKDPMSMDTYAYALFKSGDKKTAISVEETAVGLAEKMSGTIDPSTLKEMKDRLQMMKSK